jgi:NAD(P)-dependent dehydrogenase (short-subunit alcohol dehydrogenase family)
MNPIVITGGSRGVGASTALECARRGLGVVLTYRGNPQASSAVVRQIGAMGGAARELRP